MALEVVRLEDPYHENPTMSANKTLGPWERTSFHSYEHLTGFQKIHAAMDQQIA
jgi:hypothetical protein